MTPAAPPFPVPDAPVAAVGPRWTPSPEFLIRVGIVLFATALRLYNLDLRPPHFDEGVNGWFTDQMQKNGFYAYDPTNYHGPLHFYVLFLFKCLFGRHVWALRLPVVLMGILTVDWLFRFERFIGRTASAWAALAMAVSPGLLYYQRDAIHETWQVFFLVLAFWGVFGLWQDGAKRYLWATAMGVTGMILTKETYIIHFGCFLCAVPVLFVLEEFLPSRRSLLVEPPPPPLLSAEDEGKTLWADPLPPPPMFPRFAAGVAPQRYQDWDVIAVLGVGFLLITLFYSGFGYNFAGLGALGRALAAWQHKGDIGEGHSKPFIYWCQLLMRAEPWAVFGLLACARYLVPPLPRPQRLLGAGLLVIFLGIAAFELSPPEWFPGVRASLDAWETAHVRPEAFHWGLGILTVAGLCAGVSCLAFPAPGDWRVRLAGGVRAGNAARLQHRALQDAVVRDQLRVAVFLHGRGAAGGTGRVVVAAGAGGRGRAGGLVARPGRAAQLRFADGRRAALRLRPDLPGRVQDRRSAVATRGPRPGGVRETARHDPLRQHVPAALAAGRLHQDRLLRRRQLAGRLPRRFSAGR